MHQKDKKGWVNFFDKPVLKLGKEIITQNKFEILEGNFSLMLKLAQKKQFLLSYNYQRERDLGRLYNTSHPDERVKPLKSMDDIKEMENDWEESIEVVRWKDNVSALQN